MVFSSLVFLFAYLPAVLLTERIVPRKWRNAVLFGFSLLFYGWGEPIYAFLMLASVTSAYGFGFLIGKYRETAPKKAKTAMILSVAVNLAVLFFFKYYRFFAETVFAAVGWSLPVPKGLSLPIGISFYTFQILSYTVDLYRGEIGTQKNYIAFGTYVTLFPQLIAGPIVRYRDVDRQLTERRESTDGFAEGVGRFCCGLAKKVLLGDPLASGYELYRSALILAPTVLGAWMTVILYTLHLYFDFSGYSDMAIGLGKLFGFDFPENFNYPYLARSITEFWRRWHITLSSWFREYVYIPLGGNRHGTLKKCRNLAVVWLLTGLWHGAGWNFVLWGAYYCVILILEHLFLKKRLDRLPAFLAWGYTMTLVVIGFLIFSFTDLFAGWQCFLCLFGIGARGLADATGAYQLLRLLPLLLLAALGSTPLPKRWLDTWTEKKRPRAFLRPALCAVSLLLSVSYLADSSFSPFEYLQF